MIWQFHNNKAGNKSQKNIKPEAFPSARISFLATDSLKSYPGPEDLLSRNLNNSNVDQ